MADVSHFILETISAGIARITLNRPAARHAMSMEMWQLLRVALERHAADEAVRCVVLTGAGEAFCAGGDVQEFVSIPLAADPAAREARLATLNRVVDSVRLLHEMAKPTLAVIPGPAAGAGLSLALACDLRICADTAKFTTAFARVGVSGDFGGSWFLSRMVGSARARELYLRSTVFTAQEALAWGLVNNVVRAADLQIESDGLAAELANGPTMAFACMKRNLDAALSLPLQESLAIESENMIRTLATSDHLEASRAFLQKRRPVFSGR